MEWGEIRNSYPESWQISKHSCKLLVPWCGYNSAPGNLNRLKEVPSFYNTSSMQNEHCSKFSSESQSSYIITHWLKNKTKHMITAAFMPNHFNSFIAIRVLLCVGTTCTLKKNTNILTPSLNKQFWGHFQNENWWSYLLSKQFLLKNQKKPNKPISSIMTTQGQDETIPSKKTNQSK